MLARLQDPLDNLKREAIPAPLLSTVVGDADSALHDLVGLLEGRPFRVPERRHSHGPTESPDGRLLALPCGNRVLLYDTANGAIVRILSGHNDSTLTGDFSADGALLASGSLSRVMVWDVATLHQWNNLETAGGGLVGFTPDGQTRRRRAGHGRTQWPCLSLGPRAPAGRRARDTRTFRTGALVTGLSFSPDSRSLAAASDSSGASVRLWISRPKWSGP